MNERSAQEQELFEAARTLTKPAQRVAFLDAACEGDAALRQRLETLLAAQGEADDLFRPLPKPVAPPPQPSIKSENVSDEQIGQSGLPRRIHEEHVASKNRKPLDTVRYFGDYELLDEIARGGMGVVYKARQVSLNRTVAVKMILSGQLARETEVKRFRLEAEAAANLQHPNIVAIHEIGQHEKQHYFSMDYVDGKNLAEFVQGRPLPAIKAAELVKCLADAVHFAHQRGTLHRDLKPQNVLMDSNGQPRITDFGLAKRGLADGSLTQTGAVMGSPNYMSPEQATGKNQLVGPASDVYSLGAILYQLLTGCVPFMAAMPVETLRKVVEEEPLLPSRLNEKVPVELETICLKCLEKKPERRYASARLLAEELGRFLNHEPIHARPASAPRKIVSWCRRHPWVLTGVTALMLLAVTGLTFGLWEQLQFQAWRQTHPKEAVPRNMVDSPIRGWLMLGGLFAMFGAIGLYLVLQLSRRVSESFCRFGLCFGGLTAAVGIGWALEQVRREVWLEWGDPEFASFQLMAFVYCWAGLILIWRSLRRANVLSEQADEPESAQKLEIYWSPLLFGMFANGWLAWGVGKWLIDWADFPTPIQWGTGRFPLPLAEAKVQYEHDLLQKFCMAAPTLASVTFMALTALRSPRGSTWRATSPLAIGWSLAVAGLSFTYMPRTLAGAAVLTGLAGGWLVFKVCRPKLVTVARGHKPFNARELINEAAFKRIFFRITAGLAIWAGVYSILIRRTDEPVLFVTGQIAMLYVKLVALSLLFGLVPAFFQTVQRERYGLLAGCIFFLLLWPIYPTNEDMAHPGFLKDNMWIIGSWPLLVPAIIAATFLFRAARKVIKAHS